MKVGVTTEVTSSTVTESHGAVKNEFIFGGEFKLNLGITDELSIGGRLEVMNGTHNEFAAVGGRVEFMPRHGRIVRGTWTDKMADEQREIASATELIAKDERTIVAKAEETVGTLEQKARLLEWKVKSMDRVLPAARDRREDHRRQDRRAQAGYQREGMLCPGSFSVNSSGVVEMGGSPAEMEAGVKVVCNGSKVTANGTDIVVLK